MSIQVTKDILRAALNPLLKASEHLEEILENFYRLFPKYDITSAKRIAAFAAQAAHETGGFTAFIEKGNKSYFDKYEPHTPLGKKLGNIEPGDGYRYRGRGIFQLTGRWNYKYYSDLIGIDLVNNPDNASKLAIACHIACEYWKKNNLNTLADQDNIKAITKHIKGGEQGLSKRFKSYQLVLDTLKNSDLI